MKKAVRVLMAVLMVMMFSSLAAADITYETQWFVGNPSGIAVGPSNDVYVASATNNLVQVYDSSGNFLTQWIVNNPTAIAVNSADDVYVASATNNLVQVYDSSGNFLTQWIVNNPTAIAVNSADDVYVASATNNLIQVYDSSGNFLTQWIVNNPTAIAVNSADDVYVADATGNLIRALDLNGGYLNQWDVATPSGLSADPSGNIFIADFNNNFVLVYAWAGHIWINGEMPERAKCNLMAQPVLLLIRQETFMSLTWGMIGFRVFCILHDHFYNRRARHYFAIGYCDQESRKQPDLHHNSQCGLPCCQRVGGWLESRSNYQLYVQQCNHESHDISDFCIEHLHHHRFSRSQWHHLAFRRHHC